MNIFNLLSTESRKSWLPSALALLTLGLSGSALAQAPEPTVSVRPVIVNEGDVANVPLELSEASTETVTVTIYTQNGSAIAGEDFWGQTSLVTFEPGEIDTTVEMTTIEDDVFEPGENFNVFLVNPTNATIGAVSAGVTISDDDEDQNPFTVSVSPVVVTEGDVAMVPVTLSAPRRVPVSVIFFTRDGSAMAGPGRDFWGLSTEVIFWPGETEAIVEVTTLQDDVAEPGENFNVFLANADGVNIDAGTAGVTIEDDDAGEVAVSVRPIVVTEGDIAMVPLELSEASTETVTVTIFTRSGSAIAGEDFWGQTSLVTFEPGETAATVAMTTLDDDVAETGENFNVFLVNPTNATIGAVSAGVTISDDD